MQCEQFHAVLLVGRRQGNYLQKWITRTSFESPTMASSSRYSGEGEGVSLLVYSRTNDDDVSEDNVVSGVNVASGTNVASSSNIASGAI